MSTASTTKITTVCTEVACNTVRDLIQSRRFICQFDDTGRLHLTELRTDGIYLEANEIPTAIASGAFSPSVIALIADAANAALGERS